MPTEVMELSSGEMSNLAFTFPSRVSKRFNPCPMLRSPREASPNGRSGFTGTKKPVRSEN